MRIESRISTWQEFNLDLEWHCPTDSTVFYTEAAIVQLQKISPHIFWNNQFRAQSTIALLPRVFSRKDVSDWSRVQCRVNTVCDWIKPVAAVADKKYRQIWSLLSVEHHWSFCPKGYLVVGRSPQLLLTDSPWCSPANKTREESTEPELWNQFQVEEGLANE